MGKESPVGIPELLSVKIEGPTADLAGITIGYRDAGPRDGVPIVCMHGIGSNSSGFRAQLVGLSDAFRVISWDAPGYGASSELPWLEPSPESYADALAGMADALTLKRMIVVGSSFGGVIAAAFGARYPERVLGLVLSAPAAGFVRAPAVERTGVLGKRIGDMARLGPAGVANERASALVAPGSPQSVIDTAKALVASVNPSGYAQAAHAIDRADTIATAKRIVAPTLVVVGDKDIVTPMETCARPIAAELRYGRLEVLAGVGHLIKLEAPQVFNNLVRDFAGSILRR
jgi:pimeloyl-ACP methyl ester carboxylesterase